MDSITQYLDWGGHTRTVDPIGNSAWIQEHNNQHMQTRRRGQELDRRDVDRIINKLDSTPPQLKVFKPTTGMLDEIPQFESHHAPWRSEMHSDGQHRSLIRDMRGTGELPVVVKMSRTQPEGPSRGDIERAMYDSNRESRVFSRAGQPDHGRESDGTTTHY